MILFRRYHVNNHLPFKRLLLLQIQCLKNVPVIAESSNNRIYTHAYTVPPAALQAAKAIYRSRTSTGSQYLSFSDEKIPFIYDANI